MVRTLFGAALLVVPGPLLRLAGGEPPDRRARRVARILGARHLVEAAVLSTRPRGTRRVAGIAVDGTHALTAVVVAAADRRRRRIASVNAVIALAFAAAGLRAQRPSRTVV